MDKEVLNSPEGVPPVSPVNPEGRLSNFQEDSGHGQVKQLPPLPKEHHQHYKNYHAPNPGQKYDGRNPETGSLTDYSTLDLKKILYRPVNEPEKQASIGCFQKIFGGKRRERDTVFRLQEIILPTWVRYLATFGLIWELVLYLITIVTFASVTYSAFFAFYEQIIWDLIYATDTIFNFDILMRLVVELWRYKNQVVVVVFTVPYSMFQFLLDLITIMPFHQIYVFVVGMDKLSNLSKIDYWRFNRFIRLYRSYIFFQTLAQERRANEKFLFLLRFTNYYIGFIHLASCLLMSLVDVEPLDFLLMRFREKLDDSWMSVVNHGKRGYPTEEPWQIYVLASNLATATVTTVGYGDLSATNEVEMIWCIFFMLFGAIFLNGYFTSQLTTFELELDGARFDLFFRVNEIKKYLKTVGTLKLFNAKVDEYYRYLWTYREGVYDVQFMKHLPLAFQEDLLFDIGQEMFDKSFLFNGTDEALLRTVSKIVKVALYNPEMILCRKGGYANKMYYILQGECRVMSRFKSWKPAAILRAGSIIGEANLFFSYPYTATIETRTCCQFIILEKEELIRAMDDFRDQLLLLRTKSQEKIVKLYEMHDIYGVPPVCWVAAKTDLENPSEPKATTIRRTMRWGSGINQEVIEDVIDDTKNCVIFDTPCFKKEIIKNHLTPYITCVVPEIMDTEVNWVKYWNIAVMINSMAYAYVGPYCVAFGENSQSDRAMCGFLTIITFPMTIIYFVDVLVEIIAAAPVFGMYYKFWDGLRVKITEPMFYFDIMAVLPLGISVGDQQQHPLRVIDTICKSFKLWKVIRYLHFLDNRYPLSLFWFRLAQTMLVLMYGIHFIACISFYLACPEIEIAPNVYDIRCEADSWMKSYEKSWRLDNPAKPSPPVWMQTETLRSTAPYLYSFFYSSATLTSAGFGDFNPQRNDEMLWAIGFQLFGFFLIGYYTSVLTSALSCVVRPRLAFQQKMISIKQFMKENHLKEILRDRIVEYFELQTQLRGGVTLGRGIFHMMHDCPEYLRDDVLYLEIVELLEGIPVFSKVESDVVIKMSSMMKRFIIPPNTTFLHKGEIRRVMYLIKYGSVGIYDEISPHPINVLEASSHFGVRDLLFGEPSHFTIKSMSHVCLYSIKIHHVREAMSHDEEFWEFINQQKEGLQDTIDEMINIYSQITRSTFGVQDAAVIIPNWTIIPKRPKDMKEKVDIVDDPKYWEVQEAILMNDEYDELFKQMRLAWFWKGFLMKRCVHPVGQFAKIWNCIVSVTSFVTLIMLFIETFNAFRRPLFRILQWAMDCIAIMDIYIKMHWSYYNSNRKGNSMLISHPLKTAVNYILNGTFVMDVFAATPLEMIFPLLGWTDFFGYGEAATWYTKFRWTRLLQIKRLTMVFEIAHGVFNHRNSVLLVLYVTVTIFLCTLLGSVCIYTACPWQASTWQKGDEYRMPICFTVTDPQNSPDYWATKKTSNEDILSSPIDRWTLATYYVSQVVLVIGFGDLITLRTVDLLLLIFMSVFGFIFVRCVVADVTAAEVDSDEIRSTFSEQIITLELVMKREGVAKILVKTVMEHLKYTWERSKGLQPRDLFADLHPALESDLFRELVGKKLAKVALFHGFTANILRSLSGCLKKLYFLRGERIMRCGNLEYEMCIIITGKVYISDTHFNYLCTLSTGDCFGESSMIKGKRRCYNAIAMTNVELFILTATNFELVLERYPTVKAELEKKLGGGERDYFEQGLAERIKLVQKTSEKQQALLALSFKERTSKIKVALSMREDLGARGKVEKPKSRIFGYGSKDENLQFFYFAQGHYRRRGLTFSILIHPKCTFMQCFLFLVNWFSYLTPAIATYETCFINGKGSLTGTTDDDTVSYYVQNLSYSLEILFLTNLILKFFTPYITTEGIYCKTYRGIFVHYVTSPTKFLLDMIGVIPFIVDAATVEHLQDNENLKFIYLLKIVRLYRYFQHQLGKKYDLSISTFRYKITISVTSFCLMAHMIACCFYKISSCGQSAQGDFCPKGTETTWTVIFKESRELDKLSDFTPWKWWIRSLYWVVTVVSTTGFGDILPYTVTEMGVAILCIFCGAFILSIILSHFTSGMASLTKANREYMYQVQLLVKHLRNIGLSPTRQDQVMMHFLMMWNRCRGKSYNKATAILPISLQIEVCNALFSGPISCVPYFKGHDEASLIRQICLRVNHSIFIPGVCIVKEGDQGNSMFVVFKGIVSATRLPATEVTVTKSDRDDEDEIKKESEKQAFNPPQLICIYNVGDVFGRFPATFRDEAYKKSYRAETYVEVLEIKQKDMEHLCKQFPYLKRNLIYLIKSRYDSTGPGQNIFSEMKKNRDNLFDIGEEYKPAAPLPKKPKKRNEDLPNETGNEVPADGEDEEQGDTGGAKIH